MQPLFVLFLYFWARLYKPGKQANKQTKSANTQPVQPIRLWVKNPKNIVVKGNMFPKPVEFSFQKGLPWGVGFGFIGF